MKKFIALVCAGVMAISLGACGSPTAPSPSPVAPPATTDNSAATQPSPSPEAPSPSPSEAPSPSPSPSPSAPTLNAAVFYYAYSDTYIATVRTALDSSLQAAGVTFQDYDGNNDQKTQNEQIDTAISQGANLLIVNVVTSGAIDVAQQILDKAKAAGNIPVIFFNRTIGTDDTQEAPVYAANPNSIFVGTDAPQAGHMQGQMIAKFLLANYDQFDLNHDGSISYAMFMGDKNNQEAIYRTKYSVEDADAALTAAGKPALVYFDPNNTDKYQLDMQGAWSAQAANEYMTTNLTQYNTANNNMIECIICNNDAMATGAISALNDAGFNLGTDHPDSVNIPVFGVDATDAGKALIANGQMAGTIKQDNVGMANGITFFVQNLQAGKAINDSMASFTGFSVDPTCPSKVFIPYQFYPPQ